MTAACIIFQQMNDPNGTIRPVKRPSQRRRDGLIRFAYDNTSQSGEDGIINRLFQLLQEEESSSSSSVNCRWAVDVGAWDGVHLSNTNSLLLPISSASCADSSSSIPPAVAGGGGAPWRGILIEADPEKFEKLQSLHKPMGNVCLNTTVSCQPWSQHSLSNILVSTNTNISSTSNSDTTVLPQDFDFLCIDVDGTDYWLLHDVFTNTHYRPKVICIEFNPTIPHSVLFIPPRDDTIRHGCSITALVELASFHDYQLVETTCYNAFFVRKDLYMKWNIDADADGRERVVPFEPTIEHLHEVTMGTQMYQLYDGTIKLSGCQKLLWHRRPILEEHMQVLKNVRDRTFPFAPSIETSNPGCDDANNNKKGGKNVGIDNVHNAAVIGHEEQEEILNQQLEQEKMMYHHLAVDMSPYCEYLSSSQIPSTSSPTVNQSTTKEKRAKCSNDIYQQLKRDGFALIRGTRIPSKTCIDAIKWTDTFLQSANEKVRRSCLTKDRARRGYSPQNSENFASLIGAKGSNDLVRKFRVGPNSSSRITSTLSLPSPPSTSTSTTKMSSALLQPNSWPSNETWGEENATQFQESITAYYDQICHVAHAIVNAICDGIRTHNPNILLPPSLVGVGENTNINIRNCYSSNTSQEIENTSILTLLGYKKGARHQGKHASPLVAAHTDVGVITVLLFDGGDSAVLQRSQSTNNRGCEANSPSWVDVKLPRVIPEDPVFVVNIGDCLSDMCGAMLPSTLHRVMPSKGGTVARNCLALFMGLKPDDMLHLPNSDGNDERMTYEEWRRRRIARAQAELSKHKVNKS